MKLLIDTHAVLWWLDDDQRMGQTAADRMTDPANEVLLSAVVVWEVAIKRGLGKLDAPAGFAEALLARGFSSLPIEIAHAAAVERLPGHHRDPFDRLLVAQAIAEGATIVTADEVLGRYGVPLLWR